MKLSSLLQEACSCEDENDLQLAANKALKARLNTRSLREPQVENENPCWNGYEMIGMKKKNGRDVPNCVPIKEEGRDVADVDGDGDIDQTDRYILSLGSIVKRYMRPSAKKSAKKSKRKLKKEEQTPSYMNVSSLKSIKANVDFLLKHITDDTELDNWAEDHIATAAHDIAQVADHLRGSKLKENEYPIHGEVYIDDEGRKWVYDGSKEKYVQIRESSKPSKGKKWKTNGVSHGQKGVRISPGTKRGDAYCARSYGIKGNWKNDPNSPNRLSRKKWRCRGKKSMRKLNG